MKIAFRVDAGPQMGTGHLVRCLTLAARLRAEGAETCFISRNLDTEQAARIGAGGHTLVRLPAAMLGAAPNEGEPAHAHWLGVSEQTDASQVLQALGSTLSWDWLVVDHYGLDQRWERRMRAATRRLLVIDDLADRDHDCDLLLDQNHHSQAPARYANRVPAHCRQLLGPRYALLREEFVRLRAAAAPRKGPVRRLLVFLGGVDAANVTGDVLSALKRVDLTDVLVEVVIGVGHPDRAAIETRCAAEGHVCHVQTPELGALMLQADLALGSGGSATWERCALGLPTLAVRLADNQANVLAEGARAGILHAPRIDPSDIGALARHLQALMESPGWREQMSGAGMALVDAKGTQRVARSMTGMDMAIRRAELDDADALFEWRNDPSIRSMSHDPMPIERAHHDAWFAATLADTSRHLLIGEIGCVARGVVRFDIDGVHARVSIYTVPGGQGQGAGGALLRAAEDWLRHRAPQVDRVDAEVLAGNAASHALFTSSGYALVACRYQKRIVS